MPSTLDFQAVFEAVPGRCAVLGSDFRIVAVSDAYLRATMTTRAELLGRRIFDVFTDLPDDADSSGALGLHASLERVRSEGVADAMAVRTYELRRQGPNRSKEQRYWRTMHSPVFDKDGGVSHILHNIEDVTAIAPPAARATPYATPPELARARALVDAKLAHDRNPHLLAELREKHGALARLTARLATVNQELAVFSSSVVHELRAPLRAIDGFSQLLREDIGGELDEQSRDYLDRIRAASSRMGQLIDDLLRLARCERVEIQHQPVDLTQMSQTIAAELARTHPARQVQFVPQDGLVAHADARLLRIVLENLLSNAWKFTAKADNAVIIFGAMSRAGQLTYFVRDNGVGFDMARSADLFAAFRRLHAGSDFPGTGVGLATARRIIERHGGRIWAESTPGVGATFFWTLPSDAQDAARAACWDTRQITHRPRSKGGGSQSLAS